MSVRRPDAVRAGPDLKGSSVRAAAQRPDAECHDRRREHGQHPQMFADVLMVRQAGIFVQCRYRQHARQHMRQRPGQYRGNIHAEEQNGRHAERACRNRHKSADRRQKAREKHRQRSPAVEKRLALRHQAPDIATSARHRGFRVASDGRSRTPSRRRSGRRQSPPPARPTASARRPVPARSGPE